MFTNTAQSPLRTDVWTGSTGGHGESCPGSCRVRLLALTGQGVPVWWQSHRPRVRTVSSTRQDRLTLSLKRSALLCPRSLQTCHLNSREREPHCGLYPLSPDHQQGGSLAHHEPSGPRLCTSTAPTSRLSGGSCPSGGAPATPNPSQHQSPFLLGSSVSGRGCVTGPGHAGLGKAAALLFRQLSDTSQPPSPRISPSRHQAAQRVGGFTGFAGKPQTPPGRRHPGFGWDVRLSVRRHAGLLAGSEPPAVSRAALGPPLWPCLKLLDTEPGARPPGGHTTHVRPLQASAAAPSPRYPRPKDHSSLSAPHPAPSPSHSNLCSFPSCRRQESSPRCSGS